MRKSSCVRQMTLAAILMALGMVLPFLTGQIPQIGSMLLPMHIPVFFCGLLCGWQYGAIIGFLLPLLRSSIFSMPPMFPTATAMAFELMTYGLVSGLLYGLSRKQGLFATYRALIVAMIVGRGVWGFVQYLQLSLTGSSFTLEAFLAGAFLQAFPGIILQLILIPAVLFALDKSGIVRFARPEKENLSQATR